MNFKGTCQLETSRLILRKFTLEDARKVFENWTSDDEVTKYMTWQTHTSLEITEEYLKSSISQYDNEKHMEWCIELKEIREPIGSFMARVIDEESKRFEVGYCLSKKWWNKGIVSEALRKVIKFLFDTVGANRVEAYHNVRNLASGRVMQKCGMHFEGILREAKKINCDLSDVYLYSILRRDLEVMKNFQD